MAELAITVGPVATVADFASRLKRVERLARRLHIDISDGVFTPTKTLNLAQVYDLPEVPSDLHLMVTHPNQLLEMVISFGPSLVVCHAEAAANWPELFKQWREVGIRVGLALRQDSGLNKIDHILPQLDHVLIFTGDHLGFNHSQFVESSLAKVTELKRQYPELEVGVDGGINPAHARQAVAAGADVIVTGGYVVDAADPKMAYGEMALAAEDK